MTPWAQVGFTVLGGAISGAAGWGAVAYRHHVERKDAEQDRTRDALTELGRRMLTVTLALDVALADIEALDREHLEQRASGVTLAWLAQLQWQTSDPELPRLMGRFDDSARELRVASNSEEIERAATRLSKVVERVLARISEVIGVDVQPRPGAVHLRRQLRNPNPESQPEPPQRTPMDPMT